jgi:hypothetical protein
VHEREILNAWHHLFLSRPANPEMLAIAEQIIGGLSDESPIRFRLEAELAELKTGTCKGKRKKRVVR